MPGSGAADPSADAAWRALHTAACAPYREAGRFAWHFARGKLGRDPVFRGVLERGDLSGHPPVDDLRIVDIGCGQGLLASLLDACVRSVDAGAWPGTWPAAPRAHSYHGIELMPRDVERARQATRGLALAPTFECNDMRRAVLPPCDRVVILDVLHYVDHAAQSALLVRVRDALLRGQAERAANAAGDSGAASANAAGRSAAANANAAGRSAAAGTNTQAKAAPAAAPARLITRVGDAASPRGFLMSQWVDRAVATVRGHQVPPTWGRPLAEWVALLQDIGFRVQSVPMSRGTPFANVLLVADAVGPA